MSGLLVLPFVALAGWWVTVEWRRPRPRSERALRLAWQLAALSFVPGPDWWGGERGPTIVAAALAVAALGAVLVARLDERGADGGIELAMTPWIAAYAAVLAVGSVVSSAPEVAGPRSIRVVILLVVFAQTAVGLDRAVARRLFGQFMTGAAAAVVVGMAVVPGEAFAPLRAPVLRWALESPVLGTGAHSVAAIGLGLLAWVAWRVVDGDLPAVASRGWWLGAALPTVVGLALVLLSQKRAFWLAAIVAALVGTALWERRRAVVLLAGTVVVVGLFTTVDPLRDLWDRERARPQVDNIASVRGAIFDASLDRWSERPILGDGLGVGNSDLLIDVGQPGFAWNSHSELGAVLAASGVLGLAAVGGGHVVGLIGAARARRDGPWPLIVVAGSVALLPFIRILQEPLIGSLPYLTVVFPTVAWSTVRLGPGPSIGWRGPS